MDDDRTDDGPSPGAERPGEGHGETPAARANRRICALFDACREAGTPRGIRDAALLSVLYGANVPRERTLRLPRRAFDARAGRLDPGPGRPVRWAVDGAREALRDWVRLRGDDPGPVFCALDGGDPDPDRPLERGDVDALLDRWGREAGVDEIRPEAFRELYRSPWWTASRPG